MGTDFDLDPVDAFTAGTVGQPGSRVFHLQARKGELVVTLKAEKGQVSGLADHLDAQLAEVPLPPPDDLPGDPGFQIEEPSWAIGQIGVGVDADKGVVVLGLSELVVAESEEQAALLAADASHARLVIPIPQVAAFIPRARELVEGGRPSCRWCARPMNPEGHRCPRTNGHGADH